LEDELEDEPELEPTTPKCSHDKKEEVLKTFQIVNPCIHIFLFSNCFINLGTLINTTPRKKQLSDLCNEPVNESNELVTEPSVNKRGKGRGRGRGRGGKR